MINDRDNAFLQSLLEKADFYPLEIFESDLAFYKVKSWLLEVGSLTKRFESLGSHITVAPHFEDFIPPNSNLENILKINTNSFWQRDITLYADDEPWLIARTLVPKEALLDEYEKLTDLGTIPLGKYLFSHPTLVRTDLEVAQVILNLNQLSDELLIQLIDNAVFEDLRKKSYYLEDNLLLRLWARRSILKINHSKLLLSELFLPKSPTLFI